MSETYLKCPSCGEDKLACLDEHEWTRIDPKPEVSQVVHRKLKCVDCSYEVDECRKHRDEVLSLFASANSVENLKSVSRCDKLERDNTVRFAIILHGLRTKAWEYVVEQVRNFPKDASVAHLKPTFLTLEACCYCCVKKPNPAKDIVKRGQISFDPSEKAQQFTFELVRFLSGESSPPADVNDWLGKNWFSDNKSPYSTCRVGESLGFFESIAPEEFAKWIFMGEEVLEALIVPMLFQLIKKNTNSRSLENTKSFFDSVCAAIIPTEENRNSDRADSGWYREIKRNLNQFVFDSLVKEDKFEEACTYVETDGVDYIFRPHRSGGFFDEIMEVSEDAFPFSVDKNEWLTYDGWGNDLSREWAGLLRYLTLVDFYEKQFRDRSFKEYHEKIGKRILSLTDMFLDGPYIREDMIRKEIPPIVAEIYEEKGELQKALEYERITHRPAKVREAICSRYKIDDGLLAELIELNPIEQKQVLVYSRLIVRFESQLRKYVRRILSNNEIDFDARILTLFPESFMENSNATTEFVDNDKGLAPLKISVLAAARQFNEAASERKLDVKVQNAFKRVDKTKTIFNKPTSRPMTIQGNHREDTLDYLTLPQLLTLITDEYWSHFSAVFERKQFIIAAKENLTPIRNDLAHAVALTPGQVSLALENARTIIDLIPKKKQN
ncbi:MAG: hypothetical protein HY961_18055 [Ignavibacteriae bacterium]|nr:hypothetical protein [Ignavibacteriota bacterium]